MAIGDAAITSSASGGRTSRTAPKLERLLTSAASLMASRGFSQTSIRDVATETGFSLGGMYYYFKSKEDLLYLIQEKTFSSLLKIQESTAAEGGSAELRLRRLIENHLSYFVGHFNELKVCTFELESLQDERYDRVADLRRRYFSCMAKAVGAAMGRSDQASATDPGVRRKTLFVFGMLNWIFMWFDPARDEPVATVGDEMVDLVLNGLGSGKDG